LDKCCPAVISILFSLPFGAWMEAMSKQKAIRITAILMRLYFLPLIIIPLTLPQLANSAPDHYCLSDEYSGTGLACHLMPYSPNLFQLSGVDTLLGFAIVFLQLFL
jgi:hypothetical protein